MVHPAYEYRLTEVCEVVNFCLAKENARIRPLGYCLIKN